VWGGEEYDGRDRVDDGLVFGVVLALHVGLRQVSVGEYESHG